jgi:hypothetical protein
MIQARGRGHEVILRRVILLEFRDAVVAAVRRVVFDKAFAFGLQFVLRPPESRVVIPASEAAFERSHFVAALLPFDQHLIQQFLLALGEDKRCLYRKNFRACLGGRLAGRRRVILSRRCWNLRASAGRRLLGFGADRAPLRRASRRFGLGVKG